MQVIRPPPIRSPYNPHADKDNYDMSYNDSLEPGQFPCKGYHKDTPRISSAKYKTGQRQVLELDGESPHKGGSCQLSLSYDGGATFKVIKSMIGGCPTKTKYDFYVPESAPSGQALLAWTWISAEGTRDLYMNCAWVDIESKVPAGSTFNAPDMFVAQIKGHCQVPEYGAMKFPHPSDQVEYGGDPKHHTDKCYLPQDLRKMKPLEPVENA